MADTSVEWLESQADRTLARQRAQVDTAKLLATFAAGIAATLVATAFQVGEPERLDWVSAWLLLATFLFAVGVILSDRIAEADQNRILEMSNLGQWDEARLLFELRSATLTAVYSNNVIIRVVNALLAAQLTLSTITGFVAAASLLN